MTTYVSLFLVCVLTMTSTFAWLTVRNSASLFTDLLRMESSTGLSINDGESITNKIILDDFKLTEASSVDGRNMFFPVSGLDGSNTNDLAFREGNAGDKNIHYASKNITLVGVTDPTNIYIKSYNITVKGNGFEEVFDGTTHLADRDGDGIYDTQLHHEKCPVRVAFIEDSEDTPRVFDPTAIIQEHVDDYDAVSFIDANGKASVQHTSNRSFSDYIFSFNSEPLFQISHSDSIDLTMVAWLEGTGENWDRYADATISVEVVLESNYSEMVPVQFVDKTSGDDDAGKNNVQSWIGGDDCIVTMAYQDRDGATKTVVMDKLSQTGVPTWVAMIPKDIKTNISFYRFSVKNETIYNSWHTWDDQSKYTKQLSDTAKGWLRDVFKRSEGNYLETTRGESLVYTARAGNGYGLVADDDPELDKKRLSPCIGFWDATVAGNGLNGGGGGGGNDPTQPSTSPQQGSTVQIGINLDIPNSKNWISNNLRNGYTIWVEFTTGDPVQMNVDGNYNRCTFSGPLEIGRRIRSIGLKNSSGVFTNHLALKNPQSIVTQYNYNFTVANDDTIVPN